MFVHQIKINMSIHQQPPTPIHRFSFFGNTIETLVTYTATAVDSWIAKTGRFRCNQLHPLIVGLDVEWRPNLSDLENHPVATLQLCVANHCLIFQFIHSPGIPESLVNFLRDPSHVFVGVGVDGHVEKLRRDYGLVVGRALDLRELAVDVYGAGKLRYAGLKKLSSMILGKEIKKERCVTLSDWDNLFLTPLQVEYAAIDALVCFEIGWVLMNHISAIKNWRLGYITNSGFWSFSLSCRLTVPHLMAWCVFR